VCRCADSFCSSALPALPPSFFKAAAAKARGNDAFVKGDFAAAVTAFTEAIEQDPTDAVFYSNRSGAYASLKQFDKALQDANKCVELKPEFIKGYSRQGVAHFGLNQLAEAKAAYETGLKRDASNSTLLEGLKDVEARQRAPPRPSGGEGLGGMFGPDMFVKLQNDPVTREYLKDPSFVSKISQLQSNPNNLGSMLSDPRLSKALGVILGVDLQAMGGGAGGAGGFPGAAAAGGAGARQSSGGVEVDEEDSDDEEDGAVRDEKSSGASKFKHTANLSPEAAQAAREATYPQGAKVPEPTKVLTEEERAELEAKKKADEEARVAREAKAKVRAEADKEKALGNEQYKKRAFAEALAHYEKARSLDSSNIVYYNNISAVHMEQKEYTKAIEMALAGVEAGKNAQADFRDVAKALARVGAAYHALGDLAQAEEYYGKSLVEDYNDKTKQALKKLQEAKKKAEEEAYIDPVKSEEHKAKGNELFNAGKFAESIAEYSEALKRDPKNYKVYSNRAAAYTKMMSWGQGLEDCEKVRQRTHQPRRIQAHLSSMTSTHILLLCSRVWLFSAWPLIPSSSRVSVHATHCCGHAACRTRELGLTMLLCSCPASLLSSQYSRLYARECGAFASIMREAGSSCESMQMHCPVCGFCKPFTSLHRPHLVSTIACVVVCASRLTSARARFRPS
jgi:stress-induced-phosphoprotein 1